MEIIENKIWEWLKRKDVSLAMIFNSNGIILWHKGRSIKGNTIDSGEGFFKNDIRKVLHNKMEINGNEGILITPRRQVLSNSVVPLPLKTLIIQRLNSNYFLYIDSKASHPFFEKELQAFKALGEVLAETISQMEEDNSKVEVLVGESKETKKVRELIMNYSRMDEPIILLGETGVGKSLVAELIHRFSGKRGNFVVTFAPTIPESLFESTLFGHKRGAFTDAKYDKMGLVEEGREGTLFIDEVSEVPPFMQPKLLRFIESKKYQVLGESCEREADVRIIAASNKNLIKAVEDGCFRDDLYYRLNVLEIYLPPLRERKEDIKTFVEAKRHLLNGKKTGEGFIEALCDHHWPGNFRELITVLKRAALCPQDLITGKRIQNIINQSHSDKAGMNQNRKIDQIWNDLKAGKTFWEIVKKPFMQRDFNRSEVKGIIHCGLRHSDGKYKNLIKLFNIPDGDYHKFMTFLNDHKLR